MEEIWVDIKGFEGKYQISNTGKVISLNYNNTKQPKLLKIKKNKYGYNEVCLSKNNKRKFYLILTLVANHFLVKPAEDMIPMHIGNIDDDNVTNIAYGYRTEILHNMYKKGNRKIGKPSGNKLSYNGKSYKSISKIAEDYNISSRLLLKRLNKGWTLEEALSIPKLDNYKKLKIPLYKYNDKLYSIKQLAEISNGISESAIRKRLARHWNIDEAVEIPLSINKKGK